MRKLLSLSLVASVMALTGIVATPGPASAISKCQFLFNSPPLTFGVAGRTVHVPGVKPVVCFATYGDDDPVHVTQWATPRVQPGSCPGAGVLEPACFTIYVDLTTAPGVSNVTLETYVDGVAQEPVSVDPPHYSDLAPTPVCVFSVGYPAAPTHDCLTFLDIGQ